MIPCTNPLTLVDGQMPRGEGAWMGMIVQILQDNRKERECRDRQDREDRERREAREEG